MPAIEALRGSPPSNDGGVGFVRSNEPRPPVDPARARYLRERYFQKEKLRPGELGVVELLHQARDRA